MSAKTSLVYHRKVLFISLTLTYSFHHGQFLIPIHFLMLLWIFDKAVL